MGDRDYTYSTPMDFHRRSFLEEIGYGKQIADVFLIFEDLIARLVIYKNKFFRKLKRVFFRKGIKK
jgi:hypothetical protein